MAQQQVHVAFVCLPRHVEQVASDRNRADGAIDDEIGDHPKENGVRGSEPPSLKDDVGRNGKAGGIADAGHEPDQPVQAEAEAGAGKAELAIE
jgi:hypothetical protein